MEIKATLQKPYTEEEKIEFIVEYNHNQGYVIEETETELQALGYTAEELQQQEAERIAMLNLTAADVERGIYKAKGMDFDDIVAFITQLSQTVIDEETGEVIQQGIEVDIKALKIELKANHFYRGNPYVNLIGNLLGFTSEQLDKFFEDGNYEHLLVKKEQELPTNEIVLPEEPTNEDITNE